MSDAASGEEGNDVKVAELAMLLMASTVKHWAQFGDIPAVVMLNGFGYLAEAIFFKMKFNEPSQRLDEFDHWVAHTRQRLIDRNKAELS